MLLFSALFACHSPLFLIVPDPCLTIWQYKNEPVSWFQKMIRGDMMALTDHISKEMNELNLIRCQKIPKCPGADWRDLPDEKVIPLSLTADCEIQNLKVLV